MSSINLPLNNLAIIYNDKAFSFEEIISIIKKAPVWTFNSNRFRYFVGESDYWNEYVFCIDHKKNDVFIFKKSNSATYNFDSVSKKDILGNWFELKSTYSKILTEYFINKLEK